MEQQEFESLLKNQLGTAKENQAELEIITNPKKLSVEASYFYKKRKEEFQILKEWYDQYKYLVNHQTDEKYKELDNSIEKLKELGDTIYCNLCQKLLFL